MHFALRRCFNRLRPTLATGLVVGAVAVAVAGFAGPWSQWAVALTIVVLAGVVTIQVRRARRDDVGLMASRHQLERIVESLQEGFALFDDENRLVLYNSKYRQIFELVDDRTSIGVKFVDLIQLAAQRGQNIDAVENADDWIERRLASHRKPAGRFEHNFTDGRWIWVEETKTPGNWTLSTYVDITHLKRRELELRTAKERAEVADQLKKDLLSNLSHELRTPLNAILGFSEIMSAEIMGPISPTAYRAYARDIHESGKHLFQLIDRMLDMAKIEAGETGLEEGKVDVDDLFVSCVRFVDERVVAARLDLNLVPSGIVLYGDELRLKQIVLNLLSNAVKFTPPGGSVNLTAELVAGQPVIVVSDSGHGMTAQEIEVALTPFGQVEGPYARYHEGTGLGLPLAGSLVELHGGTMAIESSPGVGTIVRVLLPRERLASVTPNPLSAPSESQVPDGSDRQVMQRVRYLP